MSIVQDKHIESTRLGDDVGQKMPWVTVVNVVIRSANPPANLSHDVADRIAEATIRQFDVESEEDIDL